jgi:hypothetical protein
MADLATMLGGLSAGLSGQLPQWQQVQNQKQQLSQQEQQMKAEQEAERQKTMFIDAQAARDLLEQGNVNGIINLGMQRLGILKELGVDPSDTMRITNLAIAAQKGEPQAVSLLRDELDTAVQIGQAYGILKPPPGPQMVPGSSVVNGQVVMMGAEGPQAMAIRDFAQPQKQPGNIVSGKKAVELGLDPKMQYWIDPESGKPSVLSEGGVKVSVGDQGGPTEELGKGFDKQFVALIDQAGISAQAAPVIESLKQLSAETTEGRIGAIMSTLFPGADFADANMAYTSLVNQNLPSLRTPGSGAQSDKDIDVLTKGMGRLESSRDVKLLVLETMANKNALNQQLADVAEAYAGGDITRKEAMAQRRQLESKPIMSPRLKALLNNVAPATGSAQVPKTALDAGITQEEWATLTPEQQAVWP